MPPTTLEYRADHLLVRFEGRSALGTLRRTLAVPYRNVARVEVTEPDWPPAMPWWAYGLHLPQLAAMGEFHHDGRRRFLYYDRTTERTLTIRLEDDVLFDEVSLDVPEAEAHRDHLARRVQQARAAAPPRAGHALWRW